MNAITLTPAQLDELIATARAEIVASILAKQQDRITLLSRVQAAGMLNLDPNTLDRLPIPRVVISPKRLVSYRLSDIAEFIEKNIERP